MGFIKKVVAVRKVSTLAFTLFDRIRYNAVKLESNNCGEELNIQVPADLELSEKIDGKVKMYSAKLTFRCKNDSFIYGHYIYIVRLADGEQLVLGDVDRPFPTEACSLKLSSDEGSSQLMQVTVSYSSHLPVPSLV